MGSGDIICTRFHKVWFRHSKVDRADIHRHREQGDLMTDFIFFKIKKVV
jgi:hypothetical protein